MAFRGFGCVQTGVLSTYGKGIVHKKWYIQSEADKKENKTGMSKVGAISEAQKAQNIFFEKKLEIFENFAFGKCRIMPKM